MYAQQQYSVDAPFLLVCRECGAEANDESHDQAMVEGWTEIDYSPHMLAANFIGLCPECREQFGHWPTAEDQLAN